MVNPTYTQQNKWKNKNKTIKKDSNMVFQVIIKDFSKEIREKNLWNGSKNHVVSLKDKCIEKVEYMSNPEVWGFQL